MSTHRLACSRDNVNDINVKAANELGSTPGQRIKTLRERAGLTQTQLARELGEECTQSRVSSWENDRVIPERKYIEALCAFFGVTAEQIWQGKSISSLGVEEVRNEELKKVLDSREWKQLPIEKRSALAVLLNDVDVEEYEVRSVMATLLRGWKSTRKPR